MNNGVVPQTTHSEERDNSIQLELEKRVKALTSFRSSAYSSSIASVNVFLQTNINYPFNFNVKINGVSLFYILLNNADNSPDLCATLLNFSLEDRLESVDWNCQNEKPSEGKQTPLMKLINFHKDSRAFQNIIFDKILASNYKCDWKIVDDQNLSALNYICIISPYLLSKLILNCKTKNELDELGLTNQTTLEKVVCSLFQADDNLFFALFMIYPSLVGCRFYKNQSPFYLNKRNLTTDKIQHFEALCQQTFTEFWHYTTSVESSCEKVNNDVFFLILRELIEIKFKDYLDKFSPDEKNWILKFSVEGFISNGATPSDLDEAIAKSWEIDYKEKKAVVANESRIKTSQLAVRKYRLTRPAEDLDHIPIGRFNRLRTEIVESALSQLQKDAVLPPIITAFQRSKIVEVVGKFQGQFTENAVLDDLRKTFHKKLN